MTLTSAPRALVVVNGADVYEEFLVDTDKRHPVTRGTAPFGITHEHYLVKTADDARVVAWRRTDAGGREPLVHVRREGRGRVCYVQLRHDMRAWDDPPVREIVTRAARWARGGETR
jgi:type 1 glutamine amidotransferase